MSAFPHGTHICPTGTLIAQIQALTFSDLLTDLSGHFLAMFDQPAAKDSQQLRFYF